MNRFIKDFHRNNYTAAYSKAVVDDPLLIVDSYITNTEPEDSREVFDSTADKFVNIIEQNQYTLYRYRPTIKIGGQNGSIYRSVVLLDTQKYIKDALNGMNGYTTGTPYSVLNANLTLTCENGKTGGIIYASMLPLGISLDETVSWTKPSEVYGVTWEDGGSTEPLAEQIIAVGNWNGSDLSFDITPFLNIWLSSTDSTLAVLLKSEENSDETWEFHSQQAESPSIGGQYQSNCVFLGSGDTNSIQTEGIFVQIQPDHPYLSIKNAETESIGTKKWSAFNASLAIGSTFTMYTPDVNTSSATYTLLDKRESGEFIVSGYTAGFDAEIYTSAEFSTISPVPYGSGIVEFSNPSNSLLVDLERLQENDAIIFEYTPNISPNNAKSYTVDFYADEQKFNNRARVYLKEQTVSENRNGLSTIVKRNSVRPRLSVSLSI